MPENTPKSKAKSKAKPKATENTANKVETKSRRKDLATQLGEAVFVREKMNQALNKQSILCNQLATEIERLDAEAEKVCVLNGNRKLTNTNSN